MRIYNAKESLIDLPLAGDTRVRVASHAVSGEFMPNDNLLKLIASLYDEDDIAIIISGAFEMNMMSSYPSIAALVCQSLDEAVGRFSAEPEVETEPEVKVEEETKPVEEEKVEEEETKPEVEAEAEPEAKVEAEPEAEPKKVIRKRRR